MDRQAYRRQQLRSASVLAIHDRDRDAVTDGCSARVANLFDLDAVIRSAAATGPRQLQIVLS